MTPSHGMERVVELTSNVYLSAGSHIVYTYTNMNAYFENAAYYLAEGIDKNQTVICIDRPEHLGYIKKTLEDGGYSKGQINRIIFADADDYFGAYGDFSIDYISRKCNQLLYPYLEKNRTVRAWGFMTWKNEQEPSTLWARVALHNKIHDAFTSEQNNYMSVCAYDGLTLPAFLLNELLRTHEYHLTDTELAPSHLYKRKSVRFPAISEQIKLEKAAQEKAIHSEKLSVAGELVGSIAHELRNPLTTVKGFLQLIEKSGDMNDKSKKYLATVNGELEKIERIASEFLALARPHKENKTENNLSELLENVQILMEPEAANKAIAIHKKIDNQNITIMCDDVKIKQVFINVIKNAIEAMDEGDITLYTQDEMDNVHIFVTDNGPGIPDDILNQLNQPFMTTKENGTGLGILISEKIVEDHNGTLLVESDVGKGTTFTVTLPKA